MTVTDVLCAKCGERVFLETDHVEIEGEHLPRTEFANVDEYAMHEECWADVTSDWSDPA